MSIMRVLVLTIVLAIGLSACSSRCNTPFCIEGQIAR